MSLRYDLVLDTAHNRISERKIRKKKKKNSSVLMYLGGAGDIGLTIMLPILLALFIGTKLDVYWHTKPVMTLVVLVFGIVVSIYSAYKKIIEMIRT